MAITPILYTDFVDGASGVSVRNKLNNLGSDVAALSIEAEAERSAITLAIGWADYNDLTTATTPIAIIGNNTYQPLTNDGAGTYTNKTYLPDGVTDVWQAGTNLFDFSELKLGDMIDIRVDLEITTTAVSQSLELALELGTGGTTYDIHMASAIPKSIGTYKINRFTGIYIGDANTLSNGGRFKVKSDSDCTVKVNGWYCKVISQ